MTNEQAEFIKAACDSVEIVCTIQKGYSGRGMFGKRTTAVVVPNELEVIGAVVSYLKDLARPEPGFAYNNPLSHIPQLDDLSRDSMGRDSVVLY